MKLSRWLLPLALLLACLCAGAAFAQGDKFDGLVLIITVVKSGAEERVEGATVTVGRSGTNSTGRSLEARTATTDHRGVAFFDNIDFDLSNGKTVTLTVTAKDYKRFENTRLGDYIRRLGDAKTLKLEPIPLEPEGGGTANQSQNQNQNQSQNQNQTSQAPNVNAAVAADPTAVRQPEPFAWFGIPAFLGWVWDALNVVAFWAGWLAILYLLWLFPFRPLWRRYFAGGHPTDPQAPPEKVDLQTLNGHLKQIQRVLLNVATKEQSNDILKRLEENLRNVTTAINNLSARVNPQPGGGQGVVGWQGQDGVGSASPVWESPAEREAAMMRRLPFVERAYLSYQKLVNREQPDYDPLYLDADSRSTPLGKMADSTVYLNPAHTRQSTFVLFTEDNKVGWVFPNPVVAYSKAELGEVFPNLTEAMFESSRESIHPARVSRVDETRWKVDAVV